MIRYASNPAHTAASLHAAGHPQQKSIVSDLAKAFRELSFNGEVITTEALRGRGFSESTVREHGPAARVLARRGAIRQIA